MNAAPGIRIAAGDLDASAADTVGKGKDEVQSLATALDTMATSLRGQLEAERRVVFRYCRADGEITDAANPNGSARNIAGICSERRNVVGLMPHPERACEPALGSADGLVMFESVISALTANGALRSA